MSLAAAMIGLATLAVSKARVDGTWASFCAGAEASSQIVAALAFPR